MKSKTEKAWAICDLIKPLRNTQKMSQNDLRNKSSCDVSRIENGKSVPRLDKFLQVCEDLDWPPGWLIITEDMIDKGVMDMADFKKFSARRMELKKAANSAELVFVKTLYKMIES